MFSIFSKAKPTKAVVSPTPNKPKRRFRAKLVVKLLEGTNVVTFELRSSNKLTYWEGKRKYTHFKIWYHTKNTEFYTFRYAPNSNPNSYAERTIKRENVISYDTLVLEEDVSSS